MLDLKALSDRMLDGSLARSPQIHSSVIHLANDKAKYKSIAIAYSMDSHNFVAVKS